MQRPVLIHTNPLSVPRTQHELLPISNRKHQLGHCFGRMLKVGIHTHHPFPVCLAEPAHDSGRESAFRGTHDDTNVVAFGGEIGDGFDGAIARVVVDDDHFDIAEFGRGCGVRTEGLEESCDERSDVAIFAIGGTMTEHEPEEEDEGVEDERACGV